MGQSLNNGYLEMELGNGVYELEGEEEGRERRREERERGRGLQGQRSGGQIKTIDEFEDRGVKGKEDQRKEEL